MCPDHGLAVGESRGLDSRISSNPRGEFEFVINERRSHLAPATARVDKAVEPVERGVESCLVLVSDVKLVSDRGAVHIHQ